MDIIIIADNDINEIIAVYTLNRFIQEANKEYSEYNGDKKHFTLGTIDAAINWYIDTNDNLSLDMCEVEDVDNLVQNSL